MKNFKTLQLIALFISTSLFLTSCSDNHDHDHDHEGELITTLTYTLTSGNDIVTLTYRDLDGEGGAAGTFDISGPLMANTSYTGSLTLLNETESPAENKTAEISAEGTEHEFFFSSTISGVTFTKTDVDANNNPIGLSTTVNTGAAGSGSITVILKHEPTKPNNGTAAGAGGSTDIEVTFANISIQ